MDENKSDILSEIFDKTGEPAPPQERPRFEYPPENEPAAAPPPEAAGARLLPWLCMMLGAALLALGVCLLQLTQMNHRLDSMEETVQSVALIDQLQRDNKILQLGQEKLEGSVQQAELRTRELERENQAIYERYYAEQSKKRQLNYLWYLRRFMEAGDELMAAALVRFSSGTYGPGSEGGAYYPAQLEEYRAYAQELIDRGYLKETEELSDVNSALPLPLLVFPEQWDPSQNDDTAAVSLLWCALDAHFIQQSDEAAAQYLYLYPLGRPSSGYQDRVKRLVSPFTMEQFETMKQELVDSENLTVEEDGAMSVGPGFHPDMLYNLPFTLPPSQIYLYGKR